MYGWIIDKDHLDGPTSPDVGTVGPRSCPDWMEERLKNFTTTAATGAALGTKCYRFKMYDDDGILYYTGRMITDEGKTERACAGPLDDFGRPGAGAVSIIYPGHKEMDVG